MVSYYQKSVIKDAKGEFFLAKININSYLENSSIKYKNFEI